MLEKYDIGRGLFHGFDGSPWIDGGPEERLRLLPAAQEPILAQRDGKERLVQSGDGALERFVLAVPLPPPLPGTPGIRPGAIVPGAGPPPHRR